MSPNPEKLPLRWHTDPNSGERALFPALTPAQIQYRDFRQSPVLE